MAGPKLPNQQSSRADEGQSRRARASRDTSRRNPPIYPHPLLHSYPLRTAGGGGGAPASDPKPPSLSPPAGVSALFLLRPVTLQAPLSLPSLLPRPVAAAWWCESSGAACDEDEGRGRRATVEASRSTASSTDPLLLTPPNPKVYIDGRPLT